MRALVTGGTGFLGSYIARQLAGRGVEVTVTHLRFPRPGGPPLAEHTGTAARRDRPGLGRSTLRCRAPGRGLPLRGTALGAPFMGEPGRDLPSEPGRHPQPPRGDPANASEDPVRFCWERGGVRHPGHDPHARGRPPPAHQPVRLEQGRCRPAVLPVLHQPRDPGAPPPVLRDHRVGQARGLYQRLRQPDRRSGDPGGPSPHPGRERQQGAGCDRCPRRGPRHLGGGREGGAGRGVQHRHRRAPERAQHAQYPDLCGPSEDPSGYGREEATPRRRPHPARGRWSPAPARLGTADPVRGDRPGSLGPVEATSGA